MKIHFLGAADGVTGSRHLVESAGSRILLDCGLFQGWKLHRERNWVFPPELRELDAVVISHAHLDHSGWLPALVKHGYRGAIHASPATCELARVLLLDSAHLQEEDARRANRHGFSRHAKALPLYTRADAQRALAQMVPLKPGHETQIGRHRLRLSPVGHCWAPARCTSPNPVAPACSWSSRATWAAAATC
jgi:metallo-beta-lactamase family protein